MSEKEINEALLNDIIKHLDSETASGRVRMSVEFDENQENAKNVSHKCCKVYGRDANQTVNLLDMYTDLHMNKTIDGNS